MKRKIPANTAYFTYHDANPKNKCTGDCVIRAISTAMNLTWEEVSENLFKYMMKYKQMMSDPKCYTKYLEDNGWIKCSQPKKVNNTKYTGEEFCDRIASSKYVYICHIGSHHLTVIKDNKVMDTWNCSRDKVGVYWKKAV